MTPSYFLVEGNIVIAMSRVLAWSVFVLLMLQSLSSGENATHRKFPCKMPTNASSCYWTHGRLAVYNGTPAFRLWKTGTTRVLGIHSGPSATDPLDNEDPELPANVRSWFTPSQDRIYGDFEVCPLEPVRPGRMQDACIESGKNIVAGK